MNGKNNKRIVITGIGMISPLGKSKNRFWSGLKNGKTAVKRISNFATRNKTGYPKFAAEVDNFKVARYFGKDRWKYYGRSTQFALAAAKLAMDDAKLKYPVAKKKCGNIGLSLGIHLGSLQQSYIYEEDIRLEGPKHVVPMRFANGSPNVSASHISIRLNIKGFNSTVSSASASSLQSIYIAASMIQNQGYTSALAGGTQELTNIEFFNLGHQNCLAGMNVPGKGSRGISRPYDIKRNGLIPGEGACIFVLEELSHAQKRNAKIYCEIKGYAENNSIANPSGRTISSNKKYLQQVMTSAIADADSNINNVGGIIGSANSTIRADRMEAKAIEDLSSLSCNKPYVTSIKANIGETFAASGAFNLAAGIGTLKTGFFPHVKNLAKLDPRINVNAVKDNYIKKDISSVMINAFGYKGINASLIVGKVC